MPKLPLMLLTSFCALTITLTAQTSPSGPSTDIGNTLSENSAVGNADGLKPIRIFNPPQPASNSAFSYQPSSTHPGMYIVQPHDGAYDPVIVSDSFLTLALKHPSSDSDKLNNIRQYPEMLERTREQSYRQMMPQTSSNSADFEPRTFDFGDATYSLSQDTLAPPYVRVKITNKNGDVIDEFSASRVSIEQTLANPEINDAALEQSITNNPFRLPENARSNFKNLSEGDYWKILDEDPLFARQEFVAVPKAAREISEKLAGRRGQASSIGRSLPLKKSGHTDTVQHSPNRNLVRQAASPNVNSVIKSENDDHPPIISRVTTRVIAALLILASGVLILRAIRGVNRS